MLFCVTALANHLSIKLISNIRYNLVCQCVSNHKGLKCSLINELSISLHISNQSVVLRLREAVCASYALFSHSTISVFTFIPVYL